MNATKPSDKQRMVDSAIRSVEIEGVPVSESTKNLMQSFQAGQISADEMERQIIDAHGHASCDTN